MDNPAPPTAERPPPGDGQGPRVTREQVTDLGRLRRSRSDRHVGGVAGGLARHLDVDPILLRVAFVVGVFLGGAGLIAYAAAWILVPEEGTADEPLGLDERSRSLALTGVGIIALLAAVGDWVDAFWFPWPIALVALAVLWFVNTKRDRAGAPPYGGIAPHGGSTPYVAGTPYGGSTPPYDIGSEAAYGADLLPPPGTPVSYARPAKPPHPRKRGPILFWFTLALIALAEGVLGVVDAAGLDVAVSAYPATALAVTTAMLLLGAFWGRAGGLILVGAVAAAATGITATATSWEEERLRYTPISADEVLLTYELGEGDLLLDLSQVEDVEELDGRSVRVDGGVGRIEVVVPDGVDVRVVADVGVGDAGVFAQHSGGLGAAQGGFRDGGSDAPELDITIDLGVGEVVVRES